MIVSLRLRLWLLLLLPGAGLLGGCARPVLYGQAPKYDAAHATDSGPLRLYFDRDGSLYPAAASGVDISEADLGQRGGRLVDYFTSPLPGNEARRQADQNRLWRYYDPAANPDTLALADTTRFRLWRNVQARVRGRAIENLNAELNRRRPTLLVVLVHGFSPRPVPTYTWYDSVTADVRRYLPAERIQFLEVYWDANQTRSPLPLALWRTAQRNAYGTGLALRQVLAGLDSTYLPPVRLLAHSSGAAVVATALWNAPPVQVGQPLAEVLPRWNPPLGAAQRPPGGPTPRLPQLRVALLAPAVPGTQFRAFAGPATWPASRPTRLVLGQNRHDRPAGKTFLVGSAWPWGGNTRLAVQPADYFAQVRPVVDDKTGGAARSYLLDFTGHGMPYAAHGVPGFRRNTEAYQGLLKLWLGEALPVPAWWLVAPRASGQ